jgi:hypothetical protein
VGRHVGAVLWFGELLFPTMSVPQSLPRPVSNGRPSHRTRRFPPSGVAHRVSTTFMGPCPWARCTRSPRSRGTSPTTRRSPWRSTWSRSVLRVASGEAMLRFCLRLRTYPHFQFLHTHRGRCHLLRASLSVRFLDQPGPLARSGSLPTVACSWRRPIALPMVHHSAEPSGLPVTFGAVADAYLVPRSFSLGSRGPSPVPMHPFATCCR